VSKNNTRTYEQALSQVSAWFSQKDWTVFDFQKECWQAVSQGHDGLLHAPTGSGKTHALWMPHILRWLQNPEASDRGLQLVWITPLKALAKDMERQFQQTVQDFNLSVRVERRTGEDMRRIYARFDRSDFEIVGISTEIDSLTWISDIERFKNPWIQLYGGNGFEQETFKAYRGGGIPFYILVNPEGLIERYNDVRPTFNLEEVLEEAIDSK